MARLRKQVARLKMVRDIAEQGEICGLHRTERLMREQALLARLRRRGLPEGRCVAGNVLDRQLQASGPD